MTTKYAGVVKSRLVGATPTTRSISEVYWPRIRLRALRTKRGLSLQDLAGAVGLTKAHVWELETRDGKLGRCAFDTVCLIAAALGTTPMKLMQGSDDK